jgi:hypothetical protein
MAGKQGFEPMRFAFSRSAFEARRSWYGRGAYGVNNPVVYSGFTGRRRWRGVLL